MRSAFRTRFHRPKASVERPPLPPLGSSVIDSSDAAAVTLVIRNDAWLDPQWVLDEVMAQLVDDIQPTAVETVSETPVTTTDTVTVVLT